MKSSTVTFNGEMCFMLGWRPYLNRVYSPLISEALVRHAEFVVFLSDR